jgi:hypothetical protein
MEWWNGGIMEWWKNGILGIKSGWWSDFNFRLPVTR